MPGNYVCTLRVVVRICSNPALGNFINIFLRNFDHFVDFQGITVSTVKVHQILGWNLKVSLWESYIADTNYCDTFHQDESMVKGLLKLLTLTFRLWRMAVEAGSLSSLNPRLVNNSHRMTSVMPASSENTRGFCWLNIFVVLIHRTWLLSTYIDYLQKPELWKLLKSVTFVTCCLILILERMEKNKTDDTF